MSRACQAERYGAATVCGRPAVARVRPQVDGHPPVKGRQVCDRHLTDTCTEYAAAFDCDPVLEFL